MIKEPSCFSRHCTHFQGARWLGKTENTEVLYCKAFPKGIPDIIAYGDNKHEKPFQGDNGIQYEKEKPE